jgi:ATP-dependent Clp protease ATP-binding subunit ClpC
VFERFTNPARQLLVDADDEARELRHTSIGVEHVLLGLCRIEDGIAARALDDVGVTTERVRAQLVPGAGERVRSGQSPFTRQAKEALQASAVEADAMGHEFVGTEHVATKLRDRVLALLSGDIDSRG